MDGNKKEPRERFLFLLGQPVYGFRSVNVNEKVNHMTVNF